MRVEFLRAAVRAAGAALVDGEIGPDFSQEVRDAYIGAFDVEPKEGPELEQAADLARDLTNYGLAVRKRPLS